MNLLAKMLFLVVASTCLQGAFAGEASRLDDEGMCANQPIARYPSPDGRMVVVVFERDCGATTGFSTQASLLPATQAAKGAPSNEGGNLFVADANHGAAPSGPGGGPELRVAWLDNRHLVISRHRAARVFSAEREVSGVQVRYAMFGKAQDRHVPANPSASASRYPGGG